MSLDLHLISKTPVRHRGTGVFARIDGTQRELRTIAEVKEHFPDADLSGIEEYDYEDDELLHLNLTHNLTEMASHVPIGGTDGVMTIPKDWQKDRPDWKPEPLSSYNLLWHPETNPLLKNETLHRKDCNGEDWDVKVTWLSVEYVRQLMAVYLYIDAHREELERFNPSNGWGSYEQLREATYKLLRAVMEIQNENKLSEYYIYCWT